MAHGQAARPLESEDGSKVEVSTSAPSSGSSALVVRTIADREVKELLLQILMVLEDIRDKG